MKLDAVKINLLNRSAPGATREALGAIIVFGIISVLGLSKVAYSLMDDQAEFLIGARVVAQGGVLYRDFWNIKPPGIFLFYLVGGKMFGFNDVGIHAFELLYMLLLAATLMFGLRFVVSRRVASLAALFSVGWYYLMADEWWLTNLEGLVNFPILLVAIGLANAAVRCRRQGWWLLTAGVMSGVVFVFKPILFVVPLSLWLLLWISTRHSGHRLRDWALLALGAMLPFVGVLLWFVGERAAGDLLNSTFIIPLEISEQANPWARLPLLLGGLVWFLKKGALLVLLAGVGIGLLLRKGGALRSPFRDSPASSFFTRGLVVWLIAGTAAILTQVISWWDYHWLLVLTPLAILGAIAIDVLLVEWKVLRWRAITVLLSLVGLALTIPLAVESARIAASFPSRVGALVPSARTAYRRNVNPWYRSVEAESSLLSAPGAINGPIFVWGSPVIYLVSGREPGSSVQGNNPDLMNSALFDRQASELESRRPAYIFLSNYPHAPIVLGIDRLGRLLRDDYVIEQSGSLGDWYRRRECGPAE